MSSDGRKLLGGEALREDELLAFVCGQRWFGARTREAIGARLVDQAALPTDPPIIAALVEVHYAAGGHDIYQLLLGRDGDGAPRWDVLSDAGTAPALVALAREQALVATQDGSVEFGASGALAAANPGRATRTLGLEQTNSSVVVDETLIVKLYRRVEAGVNPELELLRFFAAHGFANVPELLGSWSYCGPALATSLGIIQRFVPAVVDGWTLSLGELGNGADRYLPRIRRLGEVIGAMHAVLASDHADPAFAPEDASQESLALLAATVDDEIADIFSRLPSHEALTPIAGCGESVRELLRGLTSIGSVGRQIRQHGDLHLGQVLWNGSDWLVIDFEGEPVRPLPERRRKRSPLRDVAGMLRSFTYVCTVSGAGEEIERRARDEFMAGYLAEAGSAGILPEPETADRLLRIFELEKAVYELRYELEHRPDWVPVPVAGVMRLLAEASA